MLIVWGRRNSINVQKVMWTIGELGLAHERRDVGGSFGGTDSDEYVALNPNRRVPTLQDGEVTVWESNAVVRYLTARYDAGGLWAEDPGARSLADRWMDWYETNLMADMTTAFFNLVRLPRDKADVAAGTRAATNLGKTWALLERHLATHDFVAGEALSMGDIPLGAGYFRYANMPIERPQFPHLEAWYEGLQQRAAYRTHVMIPFGANAEEWLELERAGRWQGA